MSCITPKVMAAVTEWVMLWEAGEQKTVTDASTLDLMTLTEQYGFRPYPLYDRTSTTTAVVVLTRINQEIREHLNLYRLFE